MTYAAKFIPKGVRGFSSSQVRLSSGRMISVLHGLMRATAQKDVRGITRV
jgi:hypothetical protein